MADNNQYKPMVEIAEEIIRKNGKQNLNELIKEVNRIKGFTNEDEKKAALLYLDMTLSSNFVYCGNDEWDLKENNLELWDKDGSYFMKIDEVDFDDEDEDEEIVFEEYYSVEDQDEDKTTADEDEEDDIEDLLDDDIPFYSIDDDDMEDPDLDFDDDDYHEIMDDYEDMYED